MITAGVPVGTTAAAMGVHRSTLQRWLTRDQHLEPLVRASGRQRHLIDDVAYANAVDHVCQCAASWASNRCVTASRR